MSVNQVKVTAAFNDLKNLEKDEQHELPKSNAIVKGYDSKIVQFADALPGLNKEIAEVTKKINGLSVEETKALAKLVAQELSQLSGNAFIEAKSLYYGIFDNVGSKIEDFRDKPDSTHRHPIAVIDGSGRTTYASNATYLRLFLNGISPPNK